MKYIREFRDPTAIRALVKEIEKVSVSPVALMEVCGGHTMAIHKFGLHALLPPTVKLLSGPGCPVCVTSRGYIDHCVALARRKDVIITTYGDLIRVPGSTSSLDREKALGADVRIVYSTLDALKIAEHHPDKKIVFPGIGFETTAPGSAAAVETASNKGLRNFYLLSAHKVMPPAMAALITEGVKINGYICPGHVSAITGSRIYEFIPRDFGLGCVVSGFEPTDLLQSVLMLVRQIEEKNPQVEIQYRRAVKQQGNKIALELLDRVFEPCDDWWRGFGMIPDSGLALRQEFEAYNAATQLEADIEPLKEEKGCICGEILKGLKTPAECKLFGKACTPASPVGACMVSSEGACAAWFKYDVS